MAGEWPVVELSEVAEVFDCAHSTPVLERTGPYIVRSQDIRSGVIRLESTARVAEETYLERVKRAEPRHGDLVFSREGTYFGIAAEVPEGSRICLGQRMVLIRPFGGGVDHRFLRYWINSGPVAAHIQGMKAGSVAERINVSLIRRLPVALPEASTQRAIARILGALDDKIELNRKMNATLEAMARALFKSWFVDFDPVRRNARRGQPSPLAPLPGGEGKTQSSRARLSPLPLVEGGEQSERVRDSAAGQGGEQSERVRDSAAEEGGERSERVRDTSRQAGDAYAYRGGLGFVGLLESARALRARGTPAERVMWELLRDRRLLGAKFRRQHQFLLYIADFYCRDARLVVEIDGGSHAGREEQDQKRDADFEAHGITVVRFTNDDVLQNTEQVLDRLAQILAERLPSAPSPSPLPLGEGSGVRATTTPSSEYDYDHLFPSEFVESELGLIPRGWSVASIGDLAEIVGGSTPSTKEPAFWDGGVHHWATPKDLSALATPVVTTTERKITDAGLRQIGSGLLPVGTVLLSSRAPIGYLGIAEVPLAVNQGFIAMKPRAGVPSQFLLRWAASAHDQIVSRANGSTFLEISKSNFRPIQLVRPSDEVLGSFDRIVDGLYRRVVAMEHESKNLARIRDELLPKLLSGELSVAEAERAVEVNLE